MAFSAGCFLLLLLLQILVIVQITFASKNCPPSHCGEITNISYPFRLSHDPPSCGNQHYELACENNRTLLLSLFPGKSYLVKAINYNNYTLRLVDPGVEQGDDCSSIPRYFFSKPIFITDQYHNVYSVPGFEFEYVIYLNCSNPVRDDPRYVDTPPCLHWNNNSNSGGHFYAFVGNMEGSELKVGCHIRLAAATTVFNLSYWIDDQHQTLFYGQIQRMLAYGFEISWTKDDCATPLGFLFLYTFGRVPLPFLQIRCDSPLPKWRAFVEEFISGIVVGLIEAILGLFARGYYSYVSPLSNIYKSKNWEIGRITGKYVLPSYVMMRFIFGLIVVFGNWIYMYLTRHASIYENIEDFLQGNSLMPIRYSYKEISTMTRGFKDKLGEGGYGTVYKGKLRSGPLVAVKMLGKAKANGQEFISEVATIGRIHHGNVVRLIGFCVETSTRALLYEFMPNGSLDRYISSKKDDISLTYDQMYTISLGVARGIAYLHQGCDMQILHFDIKPHNILLDENFSPRVSDFGLAKLYPIDNSIVTLTAARGTIGYMAPELFYQNIGGVSYKADVYSFGMLLMEMANRRRNLNPYADNSNQIFLPLWIHDQLIEENEIEMGEVTDEEKDNVKKMFIVSLWCIQLRPDDRPSMNKVIEMLEGEVERIIMPPKPSLYPIETVQDFGNSAVESISGDTSSTTCFKEEATKDLY